MNTHYIMTINRILNTKWCTLITKYLYMEWYRVETGTASQAPHHGTTTYRCTNNHFHNLWPTFGRKSKMSVQNKVLWHEAEIISIVNKLQTHTKNEKVVVFPHDDSHVKSNSDYQTLSQKYFVVFEMFVLSFMLYLPLSAPEFEEIFF